MRTWSWAAAVAAMVAFVAVGCSDDTAGTAGTGGEGGTGMIPGTGGGGGVGGEPVPVPRGCDPLTPSFCGFPFPNDYWTEEDSSSPTGKRLALPAEIMPVNRVGVASDPGAFNEADGFSPGIAALTHMPGATITGLPDSVSIEDSLDPDSPTVLLNAETGERIAHWAELDDYVVEAKLRVDAGASRPTFDITRDAEALQEEQALMIRPAIRLDDSTRYIVALRGVLDADGMPLPPSESFAALRDDSPIEDALLDSRRPDFEEIFESLETAGVERDDLQLAWSFTTASKNNNTRWMVAARDDALETYPDGVPYTIDVIEDRVGEGIACRLEIAFDMPLYMTGGETGELLNLGADGLPEQNGTFVYSAAMIVPEAAQAEPAPLVAFGHGQLGAKEQVLGFQPIAAQLNLATFALDWKGFASDDTATIIATLTGGDWSTFRAVPERMHQGYINFLMAMRTISREADGGPTTLLNQMLATECGGATLDGSKRYYFGGSQGGILGASLVAISTDIERALLAVPGQSYNLLLTRSVNLDQFSPGIWQPYDWNGLEVQMNLALIQGLWDRAEPTGYSKYIRTDLLPNTPAHEVVIQVSKSDHQVTNLGAHIMARTIGGVVNLAPLIRPVYGLPVVEGSHVGSGMIEVDFGNPEAPIGSYPPWDDMMPDPHGRAVELEGLGPVLRTFYDTGVVENPCNGPCDSDDLLP